MDAADKPIQIPLPWAANAGNPYITTPIPLNSQPFGRASWNDGFPPANFQTPASGGIPPYGSDANAALNVISAGLQSLQGGGAPIAWNAGFSSQIGGYPRGAFVSSALSINLGLCWLSLVDANTTNPEVGGAGWLQIPLPRAPSAVVQLTVAGDGIWLVPTGVFVVEVELWGAGGASSANDGTFAVNGGGSGGYARSRFVVPTNVTQYHYHVGAAGNPAISGSTGGAGEDTTFDTIRAGGGSGSDGNNSGAGGSAGSGGDVGIEGQDGFWSTASKYGGPGGSAPRGGPGGRASPETALPGKFPGGGAGGPGCNDNNPHPGKGGANGGIWIWF